MDSFKVIKTPLEFVRAWKRYADRLRRNKVTGQGHPFSTTDTHYCSRIMYSKNTVVHSIYKYLCLLILLSAVYNYLTQTGYAYGKRAHQIVNWVMS